MKTSPLISGALGLLVAVTAFGQAAATTAPAAPAARVGIYDSRALAYAHFWSPAASRERNDAIKAARAAKKTGDEKSYATRERAIRDHQRRMHEEVFSDAPAKEALAALHDRLPALQAELGVTRLVSRWDKSALRRVPESERVEVTDRLVREFIEPTEKQRKVLDSMKTIEPLPRWRIKLLNLFGGA